MMGRTAYTIVSGIGAIIVLLGVAFAIASTRTDCSTIFPCPDHPPATRESTLLYYGIPPLLATLLGFVPFRMIRLPLWFGIPVSLLIGVSTLWLSPHQGGLALLYAACLWIVGPVGVIVGSRDAVILASFLAVVPALVPDPSRDKWLWLVALNLVFVTYTAYVIALRGRIEVSHLPDHHVPTAVAQAWFAGFVPAVTLLHLATVVSHKTVGGVMLLVSLYVIIYASAWIFRRLLPPLTRP